MNLFDTRIEKETNSPPDLTPYLGGFRKSASNLWGFGEGFWEKTENEYNPTRPAPCRNMQGTSGHPPQILRIWRGKNKR